MADPTERNSMTREFVGQCIKCGHESWTRDYQPELMPEVTYFEQCMNIDCAHWQALTDDGWIGPDHPQPLVSPRVRAPEGPAEKTRGSSAVGHLGHGLVLGASAGLGMIAAGATSFQALIAYSITGMVYLTALVAIQLISRGDHHDTPR